MTVAALEIIRGYRDLNSTVVQSTVLAHIIVTNPALTPEVTIIGVIGDTITAKVTVQGVARTARASPWSEHHVQEVFVIAHESLRWSGHLDATVGKSTLFADIVVALSPRAAEVSNVLARVDRFPAQVTEMPINSMLHTAITLSHL